MHATGQRYACDQVHRLAGELFGHKAGVLFVHCIAGVAADRAGQLAAFTVKHICVLVIFADGDYTLGILIQYGSAAILSNVVSSNRRLITVGSYIHIDAVEVQSGLFEVEVRVIHNGVGLAASGTADVIHSAILIYLTGSQGCSTGIAVVICCKIEVNSCSIAGLRQVLDIGFAATHRVGIVSRYMGHNYLPCTVALCCILYQPLSKLLKRILIGGVVQHCNVHIPALHRVPSCGNAEHALGGNGTVAAVIRLVVADDMDHIRIPDTVQSKQIQSVLPLIVIADVVHRVAQLDAEVILTIQVLGNAAHTLQSSLLLDVRQQEEAGLRSDDGYCEAAYLGPDGTITHTEVIGASGGKTRQGHGIDAVDLLAGRVGNQAAHALHIRRLRHIGVGRDLNNSLRRAVRRIAHPSDGLAVSGRGQVVDDVIGRAGFVAHGVIAEQGDLIGAVARFIGSPQVHAALAGRQAGDVDPTVLVGIAQQHVVGVHMDAGRSLTVLNDGNGRGSRTADDRGIRSDAVDSLNGVISHRRREAGGILVHIADVETLGLLAAVGTLRHLHVDAAALGRRGGHVHGDGGQPVGAERRVVDGGNLQCHNALGAVIAPRTRNAHGERHICDGVAAGDGNARGERGDAGKVVARDGQLPCLANRGRALRGERHAGQICLLSLHSEVARLTRDVAVAVLQVEGDGVQAVAEVHQAGGAAEDVTVVLAAIGAVKVEIGGFHAGGVGIGLLAVVVGDEETELVGVEGHAVLELRFGAVVVHELDGGHDRSRDVLIVCAIDGAQIVEKNIALQIGLVKFDTISCIPANAVGGDHGTEKHTLVNANLCTGILSHIRFEVLPARFHIGICLILSLTKIDIRFCPSCSAIGAGRDLAAHPRYWNTFGNVDPNA